jgi:DNA-binding GntR family transcriptional regulator
MKIPADLRGSRSSRADAVYDALRQGIRDGTYSLGARIREEEVAQALGVSRTPVREALHRLHERGLLEMAAGGLVVTTLTRRQTSEIYAIRELLEGSAARFAAQHASPGEIETIERLATTFEKSKADAARMAAVNRQLHLAIYEASHNRYLLRMLGDLNDSLALLPGTTFSARGRAAIAQKEHRRIVEAIRKRDPDGAEAAAREHIRRAESVRLEMMFNQLIDA